METALETIRTTHVTSAPQGRLIIILYDIIIRMLNGAIESIDQQNFDTAGRNIHKAQNVLSELMTCLNIEEGSEISVSLCRLYKHFKMQLRVARPIHDREKIKYLLAQTKALRSAWKEIARAAKKNHHMSSSTAHFLNIIS
jgi:flagellar protein FliS